MRNCGSCETSSVIHIYHLKHLVYQHLISIITYNRIAASLDLFFSGGKREEAAENHGVCYKWRSNIYPPREFSFYTFTEDQTFILLVYQIHCIGSKRLILKWSNQNDNLPLQAASMVTITFLMSPVIEELFGEQLKSSCLASDAKSKLFLTPAVKWFL